MIRSYEIYSRIPKRFILKGEAATCLVNEIGDNKVLLVMHELYMGANLRKIYSGTIDGIIKNIGYKVDRDNKRSVKELLKKLKQHNYISFELNIDKIKTDKLILIDVSNIIYECLNDGYVELSDDEIEVLMNTNIDMRTKLGALKLYTYLKMKVNKNTNSNLTMGEHPEALYESYEFIKKNLGIKYEQAVKYISILEDIGLITTIRGKYKVGKNGSWMNMPNIFAINKLLGDDSTLIQHNLQFCLNVYKKKSEKEYGLTIFKKV